MTGVVLAQKPVTVVYPTMSAPVAVTGVRKGEECIVPLASLEKLGWRSRVSDGEADIEAEGRRVRVVVEPGLPPSIKLSAALQQLGAISEWDSDGQTLRVRAIVRDVRLTEKNELVIESTLSVRPKSFRLEDPERLVIDVPDAVLPESPGFDLPSWIRTGQFAPSVARIVVTRVGVNSVKTPSWAAARTQRLDLSTLAAVDSGQSKQGRSIEIVPLTDPPPPERPPQVDAGISEFIPPPQRSNDTVAIPSPTLPSAKLIVVGPAVVRDEGADGAVVLLPLNVPLSGRPTATYIEPTVVEILLPGASVVLRERPEFKSSLVRSIVLKVDGAGVRATLRLSRPLGFELGQQGANVRLSLVRPKVANGRLSGKSVIVDAGHGGSDSGATAGGVYEKNLTLPVVKLLARRLTEEGAAVTMTRSDDSAVPLGERSAMANRAKADLFVSVHINSNRLSNSRSGTITFFHAQDAIGRLLAACIQREIAQLKLLPGIGIWSDTRIYSSGFSVLRNTTMPAVLIELGFINHATDRGVMKTEEFRRSVAKAVVEGLKTFVGERK